MDLDRVEINMEEIINELIKKYLPFDVAGDQYIILVAICSLLNKNEFQEITLSGAAGTGKTTILKIIYEYCKKCNIDVHLIAPTNKAAKVLECSINREKNSISAEACTIHSALGLSPELNILDLDFRNIEYKLTSWSAINKNDVLIIDECSMINDSLYELLIEKCKEKLCKILFCGDCAQLKPVNNKTISKVFNCENYFQLTEIYRQSKNNPIIKTINELRNKVKYDFQPITSDVGSIYCYNNWKKLINDTIPIFKKAIHDSNLFEVKLLAYTNKRVEAFNKVIREVLYGKDSQEYLIGDFIMMYDSLKNKNYKISNSEDFIILNSVYHENKNILGINVIGWGLVIYNGTKSNVIFVLSRYNSEKTFDLLAEKIEEIRLDAIKHNKSKNRNAYWKKYFNLIESFFTPINLIYHNRVVKRKSIDYGYAVSVHRSQGSSYNNVLIDMDNIFRCRDKEELRQLQYVALSRTRKDIYLLK